MNPGFVASVCKDIFSQTPQSIKRFTTGQGNYVFHVLFDSQSFVFRCGETSYEETIYFLSELHKLGLPVSQVIAHGQHQGTYYMIATYLEGEELGEIYPLLSEEEKKTIAAEVICLQKRVAQLSISPSDNLDCWVSNMLNRAKARIIENGCFDAKLADQLFLLYEELQPYWDRFVPIPYLDDITTKNLLIKDGHVSGVIDVDWLECGDPLTFVALTYMALLNLQYDTTYVQYLLEELHLSAEQKRVFQFYTLVYCVDFMGERGTTFLGRTVPVNTKIISRLNRIYSELWAQYHT